jgi:hypothetical protein
MFHDGLPKGLGIAGAVFGIVRESVRREGCSGGTDLRALWYFRNR